MQRLSAVLILLGVSFACADRRPQIPSESVDRFKYQNAEILLFQHPTEPSHFFFTPSATIDPNAITCTPDLTLLVSLSTPDLLESLREYLVRQHRHCQTDRCQLFPLSIQSLRLVSTVDRTREFHLDSHSSLAQSVKFILRTSSLSDCHDVKSSIDSHCPSPQLEMQYSSRDLRMIPLAGNTSIYKQLQRQFSTRLPNRVPLTSDDFETLVSQIIDQARRSWKESPVIMRETLGRQQQHEHVMRLLERFSQDVHVIQLNSVTSPTDTHIAPLQCWNEHHALPVPYEGLEQNSNITAPVSPSDIHFKKDNEPAASENSIPIEPTPVRTRRARAGNKNTFIG